MSYNVLWRVNIELMSMLLARVFCCSYVVVLINDDSHGDYGLGLTGHVKCERWLCRTCGIMLMSNRLRLIGIGGPYKETNVFHEF